MPPSKTTIWRMVTDADPVAFDAAVGRWLMGVAGFTQARRAGTAGREEEIPPALTQVRLWQGGQSAGHADGNQVRLLAALAGSDALARWLPRRRRSARRRMRSRWRR